MEFLFIFNYSNNLVSLYFCYTNTIDKLAMLIEMEIQIVSKDNIVKSLFISCKLFFMPITTI